jgi:SsrA-binding protein
MKVVASNRKARYDYEIIDTLEAGIILTGPEVKSCRNGDVHLAGSYVTTHGGSPVLKNAKIAQYKYASNIKDYDLARDRPLLIAKTDIRKLQASLDEKGVSVIPLEIRAGRFIKILIGVGRGRKRFDKRHKIKERDIEKKLRRGEEY